jgi:hypothetical protein
MTTDMLVAAALGFLLGATSAGFSFTIAFTSRMARVETRLDTIASEVHLLNQRARTRATDSQP